MRVTKMHGCGNDFVVVDDMADTLDVDAGLVRALCDRHRGIGADGLIRLAPSSDGTADVFMDYRNADGSVAEMCGNGVRCVAAYVLDRGLANGDAVRVGSRGGVRHVDVVARDDAGRVVETVVAMGTPQVTGIVELRMPAEDISACTVSMGNPHAVIVVDDVDKAPVTTWGPRIEHDPAFPNGTNVEFIAIVDQDVVRGRIWERGVGETLASGTGASAMAAAAHLLGHVGRDVRVEVPGGTLHASWRSDSLYIRGPAVTVFDADIDDAWIRQVDHE